MNINQKWFIFHQKNRGKNIVNIKNGKKIYLWELFWSDYKIQDDNIFNEKDNLSLNYKIIKYIKK